MNILISNLYLLATVPNHVFTVGEKVYRKPEKKVKEENKAAKPAAVKAKTATKSIPNIQSTASATTNTIVLPLSDVNNMHGCFRSNKTY